MLWRCRKLAVQAAYILVPGSRICLAIWVYAGVIFPYKGSVVARCFDTVFEHDGFCGRVRPVDFSAGRCLNRIACPSLKKLGLASQCQCNTTLVTLARTLLDWVLCWSCLIQTTLMKSSTLPSQTTLYDPDALLNETIRRNTILLKRV